jgi:DNA replication licensing factor MCM4
VSPPKNRRGDIHCSLALTPSAPSRRVKRANNDTGDESNPSSDATHLSIPPSSAPNLSAPLGPSSDQPDEIRAIWGTTVNLAETMKLFRDFLKGFKPKYRVAHDRSLNLPSRRIFSSPEEAEVLTYEGYLRRMRQTGDTNLNLDMVNLLSYPLSRKLYGQLQKYPQEVVPAMDQVLKDLMLEIADEDQREGREGMIGVQGDEEIADIMGKVYKVRPFGLEAVNMRDLNPTGTNFLSLILSSILMTL